MDSRPTIATRRSSSTNDDQASSRANSLPTSIPEPQLADGHHHQHAGPSQSPSSPDSEQPAGHKKIVEVACWPCRKRKAKCTGERPTCLSCARRGLECEYEYEEGLTRVGSLRFKLVQASSKAENLQFLFEQLRGRSDNNAACLLAIIRLGVDVDIIVEKLRTEPDLLWTSSPDLTKLIQR